MNLTRREFTKIGTLTTLVVTADFSLALTGCNLPDEIKEYAAVGKLAFDNVVGLLEARGVLPAGGNNFTREVDAAFDAIAAAVSSYQAGNGAGTLGEIASALAAATAAIQTFLGETGIGDNALLETVLALLQIILDTLAGFLTKLPAPSTLPPPQRTLAHHGHLPLAVQAHRRSLREFKRDWNAAAKSHAVPQVYVRESFWERL